LYEYSQKHQLGSVASTLEEAIEALEQDHDFLVAGEVFSQGLIESYCSLKKQEIERLYATTHPVEFDMYYSL
jgi:glutamine synthetase